MLGRAARLLAGTALALAGWMLVSTPIAEAQPPTPTFQLSNSRSGGEAPTAMLAADFNHDGIDELLVSNNGSSSLSLFPIDADGGLGAPSTLTVPEFPYTPVAVDLNEDGDLDIAVALKSNNAIGVMLGNGDGTFGECVSTIVGIFPVDLDAGDIDRDGHIDLVTSCPSSGGIYTSYGDGTGGFSHFHGVPSGNTARSAVIADFNADGWPDVAVASQVAGWVGIHMNVAGQLADRTDASTYYPTGNHPYEICSGDMDRDGDVDIVVANANANGPGSPGTVLLNDGVAGFSTTNAIGDTGEAATDVDVSDLNGDGILDVAMADYTGSQLRVYQGAGDGATAESPDAELSIPMPYSVIAADIDRDGLADLASASTGGGDAAYIYRNTTNVARGLDFEAADTVAVDWTPRTIDSGDYDRDGNPDLLVATGGIGARLVLGDGAGGVKNSIGLTLGTDIFGARFVDLNRDGWLDITACDLAAGSVVYLYNDKAGSVTGYYSTSGGSPVWMDTGDVDDDGAPDVAASSWSGAGIQLLLNDGTGLLTGETNLLLPAGLTLPNTCKIADVNGDGRADVLATNSGGPGAISIWLNIEGSAFAAPVTVGAGTQPHGIEVADMDRDGHVDLVVPNANSNDVYVLYGDGSGTSFGSRRVLSVGSTPIGASVADINRDGLPDVVSSDSASAKLSVYLNAGNRMFFERPGITLPDNPYRGPCVVDFNRDGVPDLISPMEGTVNVAVAFGSPTETPGRLSGTVQAYGTPLAGAAVKVTNMPYVYTDTNGHYSVPFLEPGIQTVQFSKANYTTLSFDVAIEGNAVTGRDANMTLAPATLHGTVTDASTHFGLGAVTIEVRNRDTDALVASGSSLTDGSFLIGGIPPETYTVKFRKDGYVDHIGHNYSVYNGASAYNPEMEQAGTLEGTVTRSSDGMPLTGATVQVGTLTAVITDAGGHYTVLGIPTGSYGLLASLAEYQPQLLSDIAVVGGTTTTQNIQLVHQPESVTASIDSPATGTTVVQGTTVTFTGHLASDTFGHSATDVEWRSNINGLLAEDTASFSTSALSVGAHTISVRVKCTGGTWSPYATIQLNVVAPTADAATAVIDSPAATTVYVGDSVAFAGRLAADTKGHAAAVYEWRSKITGTLSSSANFSTSALSAGVHTIYFRVKCTGGIWSPDASVQVTVLKRPVSVTTPKVSGKASAKKGTTLTGSLKPGRKTKVTLEVQRYSKKRYSAYKKYSTTSAVKGSYKCKARLKKGTYRVRAVVAGDAIWLPKTTAWRKVTVK